MVSTLFNKNEIQKYNRIEVPAYILKALSHDWKTPNFSVGSILVIGISTLFILECKPIVSFLIVDHGFI